MTTKAQATQLLNVSRAVTRTAVAKKTTKTAKRAVTKRKKRKAKRRKKRR